MPHTHPTSARRTRTRTRTRRFIPTPCIHPEARLLNPDILQSMEKASSALSIAHEIAQRVLQVQHIENLFERRDRAVETQRELMRWIHGVKIEREREEAGRVYDEVEGEWEDAGEVEVEGEGGC